MSDYVATRIPVVDIARVCHEANRALCLALGDHSQVEWDVAPEWQRESAVTGVGKALDGATPEELHESWCQEKVGDGWKYGPTKDPVARTHPCLVPYDQLPPDQQLKDHLFRAVVRVMMGEL